MKRVLMFATTTGYQTRSFGEAAQRLGVELVFATDRCDMLDDPWQDSAIPVRFHEEDRSVASILEQSRTRPVDGILVVGDRPTTIAAMVGEALGLPGHQSVATAVARNKLLTRERLRDSDLHAPWFFPTDVTADPYELAGGISYPCVVKPLSLSGSRGVMRADDEASFAQAFLRLRQLLASPDVRAERDEAHDGILVEGFIEGWEFAVEGLMHHGALYELAIFDKPDPLDGPFFEETIYVTPSLAPEPMQRDIVDAVARAAAAIGLTHGPVHAECRVGDRGVYVLEVAARPIGGLCAGALRFQKNDARAGAASISLEELLMRHALGESPDDWRREAAASGVMMIPIPQPGIYRGVEGVDGAKSVRGIDDVRITAKPDQKLVPLPEGASYLGFIFARGETPAAAEQSLRDAHGCLRFVIDPEVPMVQSPHG
jgi:ATP-grasp domain/L-amino acid ligase C-terminal domain 2/ATP-grasp N-terminal domain